MIKQSFGKSWRVIQPESAPKRYNTLGGFFLIASTPGLKPRSKAATWLATLQEQTWLQVISEFPHQNRINFFFFFFEQIFWTATFLTRQNWSINTAVNFEKVADNTRLVLPFDWLMPIQLFLMNPAYLRWDGRIKADSAVQGLVVESYLVMQNTTVHISAMTFA